MSADFILKMTKKLKELKIAQLRSYFGRTLLQKVAAIKKMAPNLLIYTTYLHCIRSFS